MDNKIFVFGTSGMVQEINQFYNHKIDQFEYIDFDDRCYTDMFDLKPLHRVDQCHIKEDDVVIISYTDDKNISKAKAILLNKGVKEERIIVFSDYYSVDYCNPIDRIANNQYQLIDTLLLGMSHSQNGIFFSKLSTNLCPFVAPSYDLFCYLMCLKKFLSLKECKSDIKNIIIEMPYYFFNYDLSLQKQYVKKRMYYFDAFNNFHNVDVITKKQFEIFNAIFNIKPLIQNNTIEKNRDFFITKKTKLLKFSIKKKVNDIFHIDNVWKINYETTIEENKEIFDSIIKLIKKEWPNAKIQILILPMSPSFRRNHKKIIKRNKKVFYSILDGYDFITIKDCFNYKIKEKMFIDHCHLFYNGKKGLDIYD